MEYANDNNPNNEEEGGAEKRNGESPSSKRRAPQIEVKSMVLHSAQKNHDFGDKEESYYDSAHNEGYVMSETERRVLKWFEEKNIIWAVPLDKRIKYFTDIKSEIISNSPLKKPESSLLSRRSNFNVPNLGGGNGPERKLSTMGKVAMSREDATEHRSSELKD